MNSYTLITGASSGIGRAMALQLAAKNVSLILVARSEEQLRQVQLECMEKHGVQADYILADLALPGAATRLYREVQTRGYLVNGLINNAGFGDYGRFTELPLETDESMIAVNITALVGLTKLFAADMAKRGEGRIMNVASLLSFLPFPYYTVYSASKAFVLAFSETLAAELKGSGVVVTALCPGTVETPFHTPGMRRTRAMKANKPMPAEVVAGQGVDLYLRGRGKKVVGWMNWFLSNLPRVTPDALMMRIKTRLAEMES